MKMVDRATLFISRAKTLQNRRLWRDQRNPAKQFYTTFLPKPGGPDNGLLIVNKLPDEEEALALFFPFRPFIRVGEPIKLGDFYRRAIKSIRRCRRSQSILRASKNRWERLRDKGPTVLHFAG